MKKQTMKNVKAIIRHKWTVITIALLVIGQVAAAQTRAVAVREPITGTATIKLIGNTEGSTVFQVQYDNLTGDKFTLTIKAKDGTILYQNAYADKKFDKKFQLPEGEANKTKFIIKTGKNNHAQTFEVNNNTRVVEEILVKKVG